MQAQQWTGSLLRDDQLRTFAIQPFICLLGAAVHCTTKFLSASRAGHPGACLDTISEQSNFMASCSHSILYKVQACMCCAAAGGGGAMERAAEQGACVGTHPVTLLPQLGHLHPAHLDALLLQSGRSVDAWLVPGDRSSLCCALTAECRHIL